MEGERTEKKLPPGVKPHRCNPHLDALLDGIFAGPAHIAKPARVFYQCLKSEPGRYAARGAGAGAVGGGCERQGSTHGGG